MSTGPVGDRLPAWSRPLAVVAHPDDESFGLGAVLHAFTSAGAHVGVLCLTHGEASSLHAVPGELRALRERELAAAGRILGLDGVRLLDHPDGALSTVDPSTLVGDVAYAVEDSDADGLIVFDRSGVTGHADHAAATAAALRVAGQVGLPVLEWTLPEAVAATLNAELGASFSGHPDRQIDLAVAVDRATQRAAIAAHASQATADSPVWRRLDLLGDHEFLLMGATVMLR